MIALFLAAVLAPPVLETIRPNAPELEFVALAPLPPLGPHGTKVIRTIVASMTGATDDFTRRQTLDIALRTPRFEWTPDHVRISFATDPRNLRAGLRLLDSLARRPTPTTLIPPPNPSSWIRAVYRIEDDTRLVTPTEVTRLASVVFRLNRLTIAVAGAIAPNEATTAWREVTAENPDPKLLRFDEPPPKPGPTKTTNVETWTAPTIAASSASLPATILAMIALGSGKAATMHRVLREDLGLSYRQEAILAPTADGWRPTLAFAHTKTTEVDAKKAVQKDVETWTEATRQRALGMARVIFTLGLPYSPLYNLPNGPSGAGDETFFDAWWAMRTGQRFDASSFLERLNQVDLATLKQTAGQILAAPPVP